MGFGSKRKLKLLLGALFATCLISVFTTYGSDSLPESIKFPIDTSWASEQLKGLKSSFGKKTPTTYDPSNIKQIPYSAIEKLYDYELNSVSNIDWSHYAYVNYAADENYLCSSIIHFNRLLETATQAKLVLLVAKELTELSPDHPVSRMLAGFKALSENCIVKPVDTITITDDSSEWSKSLTKLHVFGLTEFERVVYFDSDALITNNLDELFFLPDYVQFAAPTTYWFLKDGEIPALVEETKKVSASLNVTSDLYLIEQKLSEKIANGEEIYNDLPNLPKSLYPKSENADFESEDNTYFKFSSTLMVIKPEQSQYESLVNEIIPKYTNGTKKYDMDLINIEFYDFNKTVEDQINLSKQIIQGFKPTMLVLPYDKYTVITRTLQDENYQQLLHNGILGYETSDKSKGPVSAKYYHFSDHPTKKPWNYKKISDVSCAKKAPEDSCKVWLNLFANYFDERAKYCVT